MIKLIWMLWLTCFFTTTGCKKKEGQVNDRATEQLVDAQVLAGRNRVAITWKLPDSQITACRIFWNDEKDSLNVPVASGAGETMRVIINDLEEGSYSFNIYAYDKKGRASAAVNVRGNVFGQKYEDSLSAILLEGITYNNDAITIPWANNNSHIIGSEWKYWDNDKKLKQEFIPAYVNPVTLKSYDADSAVLYRTAYLPEPFAIDTFYTLYKPMFVSDDDKPGDLVVESLAGPVTGKELSAFKSFISSYDPNPGQNDGNVWVYGNPGKAIEACGLMYEATKGIDMLNRMIFYCDRALAGRNDLASKDDGGQRIAWTGKIEPIWPSNHTEPAGAGVEQGDVVSHIVFCAKLILQDPSLWSQIIPTGDPHHFGVTYKERAMTYLRQGDYVIDHWVMPHFIRTDDQNRYYFPGAPNTYKPNEPVPWNQAFMLTNAFVRLTRCHLLLGDAPDRVAQYDAIVKPNLSWFFSTLKKGTSASGTPVYDWDYALNQQTEDANHFAYEAEGLWIAYQAHRYGLDSAGIVPFGNTYVDVILAGGEGGRFAGKVDGTTGTGHSGGDTYVRDEYLYLAVFRPDAFRKMCRIEVNDHKISRSPNIVARMLWLKQKRYDEGIN